MKCTLPFWSVMWEYEPANNKKPMGKQGVWKSWATRALLGERNLKTKKYLAFIKILAWMSVFLFRVKIFYFNNHDNWSFLHKKARESWSICITESKNAKMVRRTKWSQSCAWRTEIFFRQPVAKKGICRLAEWGLFGDCGAICVQHGGCWWPATYLESWHLQPSYFYQTRSAWSLDQGSTRKCSAVHNFAPTVKNFVSCGRACPSHMTQNLVTVGTKLLTGEWFLFDP